MYVLKLIILAGYSYKYSYKMYVHVPLYMLVCVYIYTLNEICYMFNLANSPHVSPRE